MASFLISNIKLAIIAVFFISCHSISLAVLQEFKFINQDPANIERGMDIIEEYGKPELLLNSDVLEELKDMDWEGITNALRCLADLTQLLDDTGTGEEYALKVMNSWGLSIPSGLYQGNIYFIGAMDQCQSVEHHWVNISIPPPASKLLSSVFKGQYCLANYGFNLGMCYPDSCSEEVVTFITYFALNAELLFSNGTDREMINGTASCFPKSTHLGAGDITAIVVTSIFILLATIGSGIDILQRYSHETTTNVVAKVFLSFSFITNGQKLLRTKQRDSSLAALNGIRVISISWVVMGHGYIFIWGVSDNLLSSFNSYVKRFSFQFMLEADYSVDTFFFLSGFLVAFLTLKEMKKNNGKINWFLFYFHRIWRLTPAYAFVVMFYSTLTLHLMKGPLSEQYIMGIEQPCRDYWWTNLLYINNFYPSAETSAGCAGWGWYLANDMQFFFISPFILYFLHRKWPIGIGILGGLLMMCLIVTGVVSKKYNLHPFFFGEDPKDEVVAWHVYTRPYYRIAPFIVGVFVAWLYIRKNGQFKIHKVIVVIGWLLATGVALSLLYGFYDYYNEADALQGIYKPVDPDFKAFIMTTMRFAWGCSVAWVTFACITGYGGPVNTFLSWSVWVPLTRLSYMTYQIHMILQTIYVGNIQRVLHSDDTALVVYYIAFVVASFAVAFPVSLLVEVPFMELEKVFIKPLFVKQDESRLHLEKSSKDPVVSSYHDEETGKDNGAFETELSNGHIKNLNGYVQNGALQTKIISNGYTTTGSNGDAKSRL